MPKSQKLPALDRLRSVLCYDPTSGIFTRTKCPSHPHLVGEPTGRTDRDGYIRIYFRQKLYSAHRLAWLFVYGDPGTDKEIDHIDGNRSNNAISNLRLASHENQMHNMRMPVTNTSGVKGCRFLPREKKWSAQIRANGRILYLGRFATKEAAYAAYCEAALKHRGEFARVDDLALSTRAGG